jgi:hypothetical protein
MSQNDFNIANQGFPATRADINSALQALASNSAGTAEPSTTYAYQFWYDETNELLKMRNSDNDAWITLAAFDQATDEWEVRTAVVQAADSAGVIIKTDDGVARITVADNGNVTIANDLTVSGNIDVSSGTIKLDGNYPVGTNNVALGDGALIDTTSGSDNTSVGADSPLGDNTTGSYNTVMGTAAMRFSTTGSNNVAVGYRAMLLNTTASNNTAVGYQAAYSNTTGASQVAVGKQALYSNTTGTLNHALGEGALYNNTTGSNNTGVGYQALVNNTTSSNNVAIGHQAMLNFNGGTGNHVAIGSFAGDSMTTGNGNTVVGYAAGNDITTGSGNHCFGNSAGTTTPFGVFQITTQSDRVVIGNGNTTNAYIQVAWTVVSDARDKTDVTDTGYGLEFVKGLRPVEYKWDKRGWYDDLTPDGTKKDSKSQIGFLAQDVIALEKQHGAVAGNLLIGDDEQDESYKVTETKLIPVLVKAIQEQQATIEALEARIAALESA